MASYSSDQKTTPDFLHSLGSHTKYALYHDDDQVINSGFTEQAIAAGLSKIEQSQEHSVRVLDGELFAFRYDPYSILVETEKPIPSTIKHLIQLYVREIGHQERRDRARLAEEKVSQMEWLANHDPLTQLANRRLLVRTAETLLHTALSESDVHATLHLDLDGFKAVNDTHGHAVGDGLLVQVSERLTTVCAAKDLVARLGGDEFVILRPHIENQQEAFNLASNLVESISLPAIIAGKRCDISVSIGIAWWSASQQGRAKTVDQWMEEADGALYDSKRNGKACFRVA